MRKIHGVSGNFTDTFHKMKQTIYILLFLLAYSNTFGQTKFQKDFSFYWQTINENFAYFDKQKTNWEKVKTIYQPIIDTLKTENQFIYVLEKINNEFYNGHIFLNTNTNSSNRTIPTGSDLKAVYENNKFVIVEVRKGFNADLCGLKKGMIVAKFNGVAMDKAIVDFLPKSVATFDNSMYEYAINMLLAGTHNAKREITISNNGIEKTFYPDNIPNKTDDNYATLLESKIINSNIGYIKINNSLGNFDLITEFDKTLDSLLNTKGLILDFRETPSGGNTTVARAILGRFIDKEQPYQKHIYTFEEKETGIKRSTLELVSPRQKQYTKPIIVLVNYWTGSMGEGITIAFDGMKRAKILGTTMAGLLGEITTFETPEMKIPFSFPTAQLQKINGLPREKFIPMNINTNEDEIKKAIEQLMNKKNYP